MQYTEEEVSKRLIKEVKEEIKEKGVNPLCLINGLVKLEVKGKVYETPILLTPLQLHRDKVRSVYNFSITEEAFVNPYLLRTLFAEFDLDMRSIDPHNTADWLREKGFELDKDQSFIGNFHHHRFAIVRELEELLSAASFSESLLQLFGEFDGESKMWNIPKNNILPADIDHESVFEQIKHSSTVVQGPPGTGKTQVLVNIIGKMLKERKRLTVVSEKHVALEVVLNKLDELGLSALAYIASSEHSNTAFIRSLEDSWKFFEELDVKQEVNLNLSEQYEQRLQLILDSINHDELAGGISFSAFLKHFLPHKNAEYTFRSNLPSLTLYEQLSEVISAIYSSGLNESIGFLRSYSLLSERVDTLDQKISLWQDELKKLQSYFEIEYWSDLEVAMKNAADLQIFENELLKKYSDLIKPESTKRKKFERLYKKWISHPLREHPLAVSSHWKTRPSELEIQSIEEDLNSGFFKRRKAIKRWKQLSHLPVEKAKEAIAEEILIRKQEDSLSQIKIKFCELGVDNPSVDAEQIRQVIHYATPEKWILFENFTEKEKSKFRSFHKEIRDLYDDLKLHFRFRSKESISTQLNQLKSDLGKIISLPQATSFNDELLEFIGMCNSWTSFQADLFHSHKILLERTYPTLKGFDPANLSEDLNTIISEQANESRLFISELLSDKKSQFEAYHTLLSTPARKLSEEEKALKQNLKRGKSILVKEFGKSRQHLSLRELFSSEAKFWIQLLKPIWLSNPAFIAKSLPLEQSLFDIAIFDESTQIPLQNAVGIIQRCDRALVAGDEHQMGPTNYFSASGKETEDLLHQASYHFTTIGLKHHYRSKYPDLIRFSNYHFYNNELLVYPSPKQPEDVLSYEYVPDGKFIDRKNSTEAIAVAKRIKSALKGKQKLGVVAFSEEQLNTILDQLNSSERMLLEEKVERSGWFCKALENLQGDECDHLLISFGYGLNENDEFHHRFGPMNLQSGRNRLNVLMTRAREKITLVSSVKASSFKVSDNESVNLLKQLLVYFENYAPFDKQAFPYGLRPEISDDEITFQNIYDQFKSARELVTFHNVIKQRGWKITYH